MKHEALVMLTLLTGACSDPDGEHGTEESPQSTNADPGSNVPTPTSSQAHKGKVPPSEGTDAETSTESNTAPTEPTISVQELESRRDKVIEQVDSLRKAELDVGSIFGFVAIEDPIPAELPNVEGQAWTAADTEATGSLSWSPKSRGGGTTYAQFQIKISPDGTQFTITARMDLDGDGSLAEITATESKEAVLVEPDTW